MRRRSVYLPTWKGWLLALAALALGGWLFGKNIHRFLAKDDRLAKADVLIVEGWVCDNTLRLALEEWKAGRCDMICATGVDMGKGALLKEYKDWGTLSAETLVKMGLPREKVLAVPAGAGQRHRTFSAASATKRVLEERGLPRATINVMTEGHHARRTSMVFRKVFGGAKLGFLVAPPDDYDIARWWTSSAGVKSAGMEVIGVLHEWLFDSGR